MKNKYYYLVALLFLVSNPIFGQAPTDPSTNLSFTSIDGDRFRINFTRGDGANRIVIVKAGSAVTAEPADGTDYTHNLIFGSGQEIETGEFVVYDGTSANITIRGLINNTTYYIKIFEYNGSDFTTEYLTTSFLEGSQATLSAPTMQASDITFTNVLGSSMTVNWNSGDGTRRLLVIRENEAVNVEPVDLTTYPATVGGIGFPLYEIGTGNYALYSSTGNTVNITNLNPNTTYHFALFEYNGNTGRVYLRPGAIANQLTTTYPTLNATNFNFTGIEGNQFNYNFTRGNGARRIVIAKQGGAVTAVPVDGEDYTHNVTFGDGEEIATGEFVVYDGTASNRFIRGLINSTTYNLKVFEYNGTGSSTFYLTGNDTNGDPPLEDSQATLSAPTIQASAITFTNVLGSSMTVNWNSGDGTRRLLVIRENEAVNVEPVDLTTYPAITGGFGFPTYEIGTGNYALYSSTGNTVNITNLNPNTTYHFALFEYNGNTGRVYLRPGAIANQLTFQFPTLNATNFNFSSIDGDRFSYNFTKGNGARRIVIARQGGAVTAVPVDGEDYTHNVTFGDGEEIATGEFVVYDGTASNRFIRGLINSTTYNLKVFEYNGTGTDTFYLTGDDSMSNPPLEGSQATLSAPTMQASAITFTNVLGSSMTVNWNSGDGTRRLLVIRENEAVDTEPVDLTTYPATAGGIGFPTYEIGTGNYALYSSIGNTVNITNLNPNTTYHFALFEYNGNFGRVYLRPGAIANQLTIPITPTLNATTFNFTNIDGDRFRYSFTKGNGARRIVIAKQGGAVTAVPVDNEDYTVSATFGVGDDIGTGEFVVYDGTGNSSITISGLIQNTIYNLKVFEYNGTGTGTLYLTGNDTMGNPPLEGDQATVTTPMVQASSINFSNILASSMTVSWTNGDGTGRLLIIRENNAVDTEPVDLTSYTANPGGFGLLANEIGTGNYVVYSSTGTSVNLTNIDTNTTYHFALFEYNGSSGKIYFRPGETTSRLNVDAFNYSIGVKSWPNPSANYFNIKLTTNNNFDDVEIYVYDINGKQVHYNTFNPKDEYRFGKELAGGIYIAKVIQAGRIKVKRLIKH